MKFSNSKMAKKDPTIDLDLTNLADCNNAIQVLLHSRQGLKSWFRFCSRGFIVPKGGHISNGARLVVDFSNYCKYILRPVHCFVPGSDILKKLDPTAVVFAKVDCLHGIVSLIQCE